MNGKPANKKIKKHGSGKRLISLLLCLVLLFTMNGGAAGAFAAPAQAAAAAVGSAANKGFSGLQNFASDLSVRFGGAWTRFANFLLSLDPPDDPEEDPEEDPEDPPEATHELDYVYWNPSPEDKLGPDGTVILLKGDDANSGSDDTHPVLTWERALSLVKPGGKIWVLTMENVLYSDDVPVAIRDGGLTDENDETQILELGYYPGNSTFFSSGIDQLEGAVGASVTLAHLKMIDKIADEDPDDNKRLLHLNGGTFTFDEGLIARGDVRIEQFSDESDTGSSPEIYVTEALMNDFDANVDLTVHFDTDNEHLTVSGGKTAFDFLVFPEGFDVETDEYTILDNVHLDPALQEPRGIDNLVWGVRKKIGHDNIVEIFRVEPYDGCVYLSGNGNDEYDGLYPYQPVRTFARALEILMGNGGDLHYSALISDEVTTINQYRYVHGEFEPKEGLIRICDAPVQITEDETWSMPLDTYWDRGNTGRKYKEDGVTPYPRVDHAWVERYRFYGGDLVEVYPDAVLTLTEITISGAQTYAKNSGGSLLVVEPFGKAVLEADSLLTDNKAVEGGGARVVGKNAELVMNGGKITKNLVVRNGNTGMGGGVYLHGGLLTMNSGEITDNKADLGGGIFADTYENVTGTVILSSVGRVHLFGESQVTRNTAREGAGVYLRGCDTVLLPNDATPEEIAAYDNGNDITCGVCCISVTGNSASYYGGGWLAEDCTLMIDGAEVTGNNVTMNNTTSGGGGGIALRRSYFKMINGATVHGNYVLVAAQGSAPTAQGGGVYSTSSPAAVTDGDTVTKYTIEIGEGCEIYDNYVQDSLNNSNGFSITGGGLTVGGSTTVKVLIEGELHDNQLKGHYYGTLSGAGAHLSGIDTVLGPHCRIHDNIVDGQGTVYGTGIRCQNGNIKLNGCEIDHNIHKHSRGYYYYYTFYTYGGGIYKYGGSIDFNSCKIHDNNIEKDPYVQTQQGGGAFLENVPLVDLKPGTKIYNHVGYTQGGGLYIKDSTSSSSVVTVLTSGETDDVNNYAEIYNNRVTVGDYYGCGGGVYVYAAKQIDLKCLKVYNNVAGYAGGFYVDYTAKVDLDRCIFTGNRAENTQNDSSNNYGRTAGGAFYIKDPGRNADINFKNCEFYKNYAKDSGGAVFLHGYNSGYYYDTNSSYFHYYRIKFNSCTFGDGTAENANTTTSSSGYGGALYIRAGEVDITGNTIFDYNTAYRGGAIYTHESDYKDKVYVKINATDSDIIFRNNHAYQRGGAIYNNYQPLTVTGGEHRVIFENNTADVWGAALYSYQGDVTLRYCDFTNNGMQWIPPIVGVDEEGHWEPSAVKGRSVFSHESFIYLDASTVTADQFYLYNRNRCIRLTGAPNAAFGVLDVDLNIAADSYYRDGDHVVEYTSTVPDCTPYLDNFQLVNDPKVVYNLTPVSKNLVLAPKIVYIDGVAGDDANPGDLPTRAVKTFAVAREKLVELLELNPNAPKKICIVNTVTILPQTDNEGEPILDENGIPVPEVWTFDGYTMPHLDEEGERDGTYDPITGVLMQAYIADNRLNYNEKSLVDVSGGNLVIDGITLDGNRSAKPTLGSEYGITVHNGGRLSLTGETVIQNHRSGIYGYGSGSLGNVTVDINNVTFKNCDYSANGSYVGNSDGRGSNSAGITLNGADLTVDMLRIENCVGYRRGGGMVLISTNADITGLTVYNCRVTSPGDHYIGNDSYNSNRYENRLTSYTTVGAGAFFNGSAVIMNDSLFERCSNVTTSYITGAALGVWGGTLTATNVIFNENGYQDVKNSSGELYNSGYSYGVLHLGNGANVTLNLCTFTKCYGNYGGAIRLDIGNITSESVYYNNSYMGALYKGFNAPTLRVNGCTFGGDTDNACYSQYGGSVIWSQGFDYWLDKDSHHYHDTCHPQIYIDEYVQEEDGETVHTPTLIKANVSRYYTGAVYALYSDVYIANSTLQSNVVNYPSNGNNAGMAGGAACFIQGGSLTLDHCEVKSNSSHNRDSTTCGGAILVKGRNNSRTDAAFTMCNSTVSGNYIDCWDANNGKNYRGGGVCCFYTTSVLIEDSTVSGNTLSANSNHNYGRYNFNAKGAGIDIEWCSSAILRRVTSFNNKATGVKSNRTYTHGAALLVYQSKLLLEDFSSTNDTAWEGVAVSLSNCHYVGFKNNISIEGEILLGATDSPYKDGKPTPINLLTPITSAGDLTLNFDEPYIGRHIVCGYTDDENETVYGDNHQYSGLTAAFAAEVEPAAGALDAWEYLNENSTPRIVAAAEPTGRHLLLVPGNGYDQYAHDIIVYNLSDVYLDGQTGVDPDMDANGDIISFNTDASGLVHDGRSPKTAVKTFAAAKKVLESGISGGNIIVCGQVNITGEETWTLGDVTNVLGNTWHASVVRYYNPVQMSAARYAGYLIDVRPGGTLILDDIEINGQFDRNDVARVYSSLIRVSGGNMILRGGTVLENNNSDYGGAVSVTAAGSLVEMYDATIYRCTADLNSICGVQHAWGGALYITGGEFLMLDQYAVIRSCGAYYTSNDTSRYDRCWGGAVYVNGGVFRMYDGKITDSQVWRSDTNYNYGYTYIYGTIYVEGNRYNASTGEGSLAQIGGEVSYNYLNVNDSRWRYEQSYTTSYPITLYGSVLSMGYGTATITGAVTEAVNPETGEAQILSPGANIIGNRTRGGVSYGLIYIDGNRGQGADNAAVCTMYGGTVDSQHELDSTYSTYTYCVYIEDGGTFNMRGGYVGMDYCSYGIYNTGGYSAFNMQGGHVHNTSGGATSAVYSNNWFTMSGGLITCNPNRNVRGVYITANAGIISGGEIRTCSNCVEYVASNSYLNISGGKFHDASNACVRAAGYNGSHNITGGEFYGGKYGIYCCGSSTTNISKADIHDNTNAGVYLDYKTTLNITSDDVIIHNNACSQSPVYIANGTLKMTGGLVYDNKGNQGGGMYVGSGAVSVNVGEASFYRNQNTGSNGGGVYIYASPNSSNSTKTYTFNGTKIYKNTGKGDGGGLYFYDPDSSGYTANLSLTDVEIYENTATARGGGVAIYGESTTGQTVNATFKNVNIHDNTAASTGGGVYISAGRDSTTANPARLNMNVTFSGCTLKKNTSTGSDGGAVYVHRRARNNMRVNVRFQNGDSGRCTVSENKAVNGGAIAVYTIISNSMGSRSPSDVSIYLNDAKITRNVATASGGGLWLGQCAMVYVNNTSFTENEAQTGRGGGLAMLNEGVVRFAQGEVRKNHATGTGVGNGIYVDKSDLQFANNYAKMEKANEIYLNDPAHPIIMYRSFTRHSNIYYVYPSTSFLAGSIVVHPGGYCDDASPYLQNFYSVRPGTVIDRLTPDLIIGRIVFLDGEKGVDPVFSADGTTYTFVTDADGILHDGSTPPAALKTFHASKAVLENIAGSIYVSGPVHYTEDNPNEDTVWSLGEKQFLRRYCGFMVSDLAYTPFLGDMFTVEQGDLTLENIQIEGNYRADGSFRAEGSIFAVGVPDPPEPHPEAVSDTPVPAPAPAAAEPVKACRLIVNENAYILDNVSSADGSGVRVVKGTLEMNAGEISGNTTTGHGNAIYQGDTFIVRGKTLKIGGDVYLAKGNVDKNIPHRVITVLPVESTGEGDPGIPAMDFAPAGNTMIEVSVENHFHGRDIAVYPEGNLPGDTQKNIYDLAPEIAAMYILDNEPAHKNVLELRLPFSIYIDGVDGSDLNDGLTPETAVRTPKRAYELINKAHFELADMNINGGLVLVVNTVTVTSEMSLGSHYLSPEIDPVTHEATDINAYGTVMFKRYSQPTAHATLVGFEKPTHLGELFNVKNGGALTLAGVILDGHSLEAEGDTPVIAPEPEATTAAESEATTDPGAPEPETATEAPPETTTEPGGEPSGVPDAETTTEAGTGTEPEPETETGADPKLVADAVVAVAALVAADTDGTVFMTAGTMQNAVSSALTGGAINVTENGTVHLTGGVIKNCEDARTVSAYDDEKVSIYDAGDLRLSASPEIGAWIYLESPAEQPEVRITVPEALELTAPVKVNPSDPFHGRDVARYSEPQPVPGADEKGHWELPQEVSQIYVLNNNEEDAQLLELQLRACVYVDGVNGDDTNDGKTPRTSVRTLKQAYKLLSNLPGSTIYVVNNVTLTGSFTLDNSLYDENEGAAIDAGGPVQIIRYSQPGAYDPAAPGDLVGYDVPSYTSGPLITVPANVSLAISGPDMPIIIDGHSVAVTDGDPRFVSPALIVADALIHVADSGSLTLSSGVKLLNNNDTLPGGGRGGAVKNDGTLVIDGAEIQYNQAQFGAGVYQNGEMELDGTVSPVIGPDQQIYLTGMKDTQEEHVIDVTGELQEGFLLTLNFEWPTGGRNAVHFDDYTFDDEVRNEIEHFILDPSVEYVLVQSPEPDEKNVLELCEIFTLKYHGNGGTLNGGPVEWLPDPDMPYNDFYGVYSYDKGDIIPIKGNAFGALGSFTREGWNFVAWNTEPDGTGQTFYPGQNYQTDILGIFHSVTLYAMWRNPKGPVREYSVTYMPNNGIETEPVVDNPPYHQEDIVTVKYNEDPADGTAVGTHFTVPEGKVFYGWNSEPDESGYWYFPPGGNIPGLYPTVTDGSGRFVIMGNIVLYAIYHTLTPNSLTVFKYVDANDFEEPNKTFLFEIEDVWSLSPHYGQKYYVYLGTYADGVTGETVPVWTDCSYGFVSADGETVPVWNDTKYRYATVTGLPESNYIVREITSWSWRYSLTDARGADTLHYVVSAENEVFLTLSDHRTVSFKNTLTNPYYVNGYARSYSNTFVRP